MKPKLIPFYDQDGNAVWVKSSDVTKIHDMVGKSIKTLTATVMDNSVKFTYVTNSGHGTITLYDQQTK